MNEASAALGGYFGLELGRGRGLAWWPRAQRFESARAALQAYLQNRRPSAVRVPWFACGAIAEAVHAAGVPVRRYALDAGLGVERGLVLEDGEILVVIDYFGVCGSNVADALRRFGSGHVVVDAAQSLFHVPEAGAVTMFSPRKFVGVPDGGALLSPTAVAAAHADEEGSRRRCEHLLRRLAGDPEGGLADYRRAEASLAAGQPRAMSQLTARLIGSIDFDAVAERRRANFDTLHRRLPSPLRERGDGVPLCYPVRVGGAAAVREALAKQRIYCPAYWPDSERGDDPVAAMLLDEVVYLPCDQRYGAEDMHRLADSLERATGD